MTNWNKETIKRQIDYLNDIKESWSGVFGSMSDGLSDAFDTIQEIVPKDEQDNFTNPLKLHHSNWKDIGKCAHTFATRVGMYFAKTSFKKQTQKEVE